MFNVHNNNKYTKINNIYIPFVNYQYLILYPII